MIWPRGIHGVVKGHNRERKGHRLTENRKWLRYHDSCFAAILGTPYPKEWLRGRGSGGGSRQRTPAEEAATSEQQGVLRKRHSGRNKSFYHL